MSNQRLTPTDSTTPHSSSYTYLSGTAESRYAPLLAPRAPGKRPEKMRLNFSLIFSDGVEYSIQEARARSLGLLGKKWGPPHPSEMRSTSTIVHFNDDGHKSTQLMGKRKSLMVGGGTEPTVTINTKEALADVFGMYNSPEKTLKHIPGSKHAPLKSIEPITPGLSLKSMSTITPSVKFTPFIDSNSHKTPSVTFRPIIPLKESAITPSNPRSNENALRANPNALRPKTVSQDVNSENVFSQVFTPATKHVSLAPLRDVFTDDHGKPIPKAKVVPTHERAKSQHDITNSNPGDGLRNLAFIPFSDENARTPFKVFSRPPEQELAPSNAFTPNTPAAFKPFQDPKRLAFAPFRDAPSTFTPYMDRSEVANISEDSLRPTLQSSARAESKNSVGDDLPPSPQDQGEDGEEYKEGWQGQGRDDSFVDEMQMPLAPEHLPTEYDENPSCREPRLGNRFGRFNVLTPIIERTFEFNMSMLEGESPNHFHQRSEDGGSPGSSLYLQNDEYNALIAAKLLADELEEEEESGGCGPVTSLEPFSLSQAVQNRETQKQDIATIEAKTGFLSLGDTLVLNSNFSPPNPCNPFDPSIISTLLCRIPTDPQLYDLQDRQVGLLEQLQRFSKKTTRKTSTSDGFHMTGFQVNLEGHVYAVSEKLGEGGFGSVFKARDLGFRDDDDDDDENDDENSSMVALKVVRPRNVWEYHALRRLHYTLPIPLQRSIILPRALYAYRDESFLVLDLCSQGMLLDIVNNAVAAGVSQAGACLDELLVMFFSIELLHLVEAMHKAGFIHGDLKIDNCLLRLEDVPGGASAWSTIYQPLGGGGWCHKGLKVIDFGRTIDTKLFPAGQQFVADWPTDERDCFEVREGKPWSFETDYFGLAGIIYCMLFGKYIQASSISSNKTAAGVWQRHTISTPFKRYWQTDLWKRLFQVLLNPRLVKPDGTLPLCVELVALREEMETWLQANCNRAGNTLKGLLKKVELSCYAQ